MPKGWSITKIEDVCIFESGYAFSSESYQKEGTPLVRISNIKEGFVDLEGCVYVDSIPDSRFIIHDGDLLIAMSGATTGKMGIYHCNRPALLNQRVGNIKTISEQILRPEYRNLYLKSLESQILKDAYGGAQPNISAKDICSYYLLLPPIEEQKRIIATVDRLMSYVDAIENGEEDCKDIITKTKEKVLELAISGKLVPQDPADEPASEQLRRINPKAILSCDNPHYEQVPFEIPSNWSWATLGDITNYGKCSTVPVDDIDEESWVLELEDIEKDSAKVIKLCTKSDRAIKGVRHSFLQGYVLYSKLRTYLNKVLVANKDGFCTTEIIPIKCSNSIYPEYLCHVLRSKYFLDYTAQCGYGVKMPRLSTTDARKALVPLPPYEEQIKISAIIKELYCSLDSIAETLA